MSNKTVLKKGVFFSYLEVSFVFFFIRSWGGERYCTKRDWWFCFTWLTLTKLWSFVLLFIWPNVQARSRDVCKMCYVKQPVGFGWYCTFFKYSPSLSSEHNSPVVVTPFSGHPKALLSYKYPLVKANYYCIQSPTSHF